MKILWNVAGLYAGLRLGADVSCDTTGDDYGFLIDAYKIIKGGPSFDNHIGGFSVQNVKDIREPAWKAVAELLGTYCSMDINWSLGDETAIRVLFSSGVSADFWFCPVPGESIEALAEALSSVFGLDLDDLLKALVSIGYL